VNEDESGDKCLFERVKSIMTKEVKLLGDILSGKVY